MDLSFPTRRSPKTFSFWPCNKSFIDQACSVKVAGYAVADPDLQIREGGGGQSSRLRDKWRRSLKTYFPAVRASFCSKHKGVGGGAVLPGPFPGSAADMGPVLFAFL